MDDQEILVGHVCEALRQLHRYLGIGLVAALSLLALVLARSPSTTDTAPITLPVIPIAVERSLAKGMLIAIYIASGWLCYTTVLDAKRITARIKDKAIRSAAVLFPTVATSTDPGLRRLGTFMPALIYIVFLLADFFQNRNPTFDRYWFLSLAGVMPFIGVAYEVRRPLGQAEGEKQSPDE